MEAGRPRFEIDLEKRTTVIAIRTPSPSGAFPMSCPPSGGFLKPRLKGMDHYYFMKNQLIDLIIAFYIFGYLGCEKKAIISRTDSSNSDENCNMNIIANGEILDKVESENNFSSMTNFKNQLYKTVPRTDWDNLKGEKWPVVVIIVDYTSELLFGNGVIIEVEGGDGVSVLTCKHIVQKEGVKVKEIRIGILDISFNNMQKIPEYQELTARVIAEETDFDLALLSVEIPGKVHSVKLGGEGDFHGSSTVTLSIFPFGRPYTIFGIHPFVYPGQSGSPAICNGVLVGILSKMEEQTKIKGAARGSWIPLTEIIEFLRLVKENK